MNAPVPSRLTLIEALSALASVRRDEVVVTTMSAAREWRKLSSHPLDFVYVPSSMGQAPALGLGMALAQPARKVIVCNGDGSMLMNLGSLVTISGQAPTNLVILVFDNGVYEVTGAQPTPAAAAHRADRTPIDFSAVARSCGFRRVWTFGEAQAWSERVADVLDAEGPSFVHLLIEPMSAGASPGVPGPPPARAKAFRQSFAPTR